MRSKLLNSDMFTVKSQHVSSSLLLTLWSVHEPVQLQPSFYHLSPCSSMVRASNRR